MGDTFLDASLSLSNLFVSPSYGELPLSSVIGNITNYIENFPDFLYRVIVGSDSEASAEEGVTYVAAVAVHRVGAGGIYFWQRLSGRPCFTLKERIYNEALVSLELAHRLLNGFHAQKILGYDLEIHVDVGTNGQTREIINEITGMVRSSGFLVKTKPDSFGASKVADRHTQKSQISKIKVQI